MPADDRGGPGPTIGQLLREEEEQNFVGREAELEAFRAWLGSPEPEILNVTGPGGIGKTALLGAFGRAATRAGREVVAADLGMIGALPGRVLGSLGGGTPEQIAARLNEERPLVLLDSVEPGAPAARFVHDLVGHLVPESRVVVAGRYPMAAAHARYERWPTRITTIELRGLEPTAARKYLEGRGITDQRLIAEIIAAVGGLPLGLSLAGDLVTRFGVRRFTAAPEWRMAVRALVQTLLRDVEDEDLQELLEVCAVVRQFDGDLLAAMSGQGDVRAAFDRLSSLSAVRATPNGLVIHDDVRRVLKEDLAWRRPDRMREIRTRAQEYYRQRAKRASTAEREWLLGERLYLWENAFIQTLFFQDAEFADLWLDEPTRDELHDVVDIEDRFHREFLPTVDYVEFDPSYTPELHYANMERMIMYPGSRVRVVRDRQGVIQAFNVMVPLCQESWHVMDIPVLDTLLHRYFPDDKRRSLPEKPTETDIYYLGQAAAAPGAPEAAQGIALRDCFSVIARSGLTLVSLQAPEHKQLMELLGFQKVPGTENTLWGAKVPFEGYVLDLRVTGVEPWISGILEGRPAPALSRGELNVAMGAALLDYRESDALTRSPLAQVLGTSDANVVRGSIEEAVARALEGARPEESRAIRAVELGYIRTLGSHERAAEELNVSRATFFRLLKRGTELLASAWAAARRGD